MPKDPNIPEHFYKKFVPDTRPTRTRGCDHPECAGVGEYRAPRSRELDDDHPLFANGSTHHQNYYWFCLDHVKIYNQAWDFYEGLNCFEMEAAIRHDGVWNRPTWPMGNKAGKMEDALRHAIHREFGVDAGQSDTMHHNHADNDNPKATSFIHRKAEIDALKELDLAPPVDFTVIKKTYRVLVKKHHPDLQKGKSSEEKIKRLNSAFTYLKALYGEAT
jgi:hypothetical protein